MAEEFVDLYAVLDLPVDAERNTLRKRINEIYLDAQRNLDHRNFATRVKYQELFEVTLPQARYILLDDGRRDEYNRLVNAFRSPHGLAPGAPPTPAPPSAPSGDALPQANGFAFEIPQGEPAGTAPAIAPLPQAQTDPAQLAQEREELWKKWKSGLEAALTTEQGDKPKARGAVTAAPTSFSVAAPDPTFDAALDTARAAAPTAVSVEVPVATPVATPVASPAPAPVVDVTAATVSKAPPRPKVEISFDFGGDNAPRPGDSAPSPAAEELVAQHQREHSAEEIEARRTEHRRQITKEVLVNVGLIWGVVGALLVVVPGIAALIATVAHYYPRGAKPLLGYSSAVLWGIGFLLIGIAAFFASRELSKAMRRKKATFLSLLSYEEVLKQNHKT